MTHLQNDRESRCDQTEQSHAENMDNPELWLEQLWSSSGVCSEWGMELFRGPSNTDNFVILNNLYMSGEIFVCVESKMAGINGKFMPLKEEWTYRQLILRPTQVLLYAS